MSQNILVCTLGASWAVIPEVYGFLAPERLPLYRHHPGAAQLDRLRQEYALAMPDEIWICTTQGQQTQQGIAALREWAALLKHPPLLRIWQAENSDQLASQDECAHMRELILRAVLLAHAQAAGGQVVLSLAGGRKTMSADMQLAGDRFGCQALIHVAGKEPLPEALRKADPATLADALPAEICPFVLPLIVGIGQRSELLDIDPDGQGAVTTHRFPLPLPDEQAGHLAWPAPETRTRLERELRQREQAGGQLLGNYLHTLGEAEHHENWRSLYRIPPRIIEQLRTTPLGANHRDWLHKLPKADLHRHVGGCLNLPAQRQTARAVWETLTAEERAVALDHIRPLLKQAHWDWDWPQLLRDHGDRVHAISALLLEANDEQLQHNLFDVTQPRVDLKRRHPHGFDAYERPGELTGSAILGHPAAIAPYAHAVVQQALAENLAYVELRGSPGKYHQEFLPEFHRALTAALSSLPSSQRPQFRFILIGDRRQPGKLADTVTQAVQAKNLYGDFIAGIDLAGDEGTARPEQLAHHFIPAFEACLPITIHAGEGEPAESIWQAAYHLHADRIGHGLSIGEHPELAQRFRDRDICLELCPTSNREVVGYRDPDYPESRNCSSYPLLGLWHSGLPLTLCTDNPAISQTTLTDEYLAAARMTGSQLTLWDTLAMLKQAFAHAFLPAQQKEALIKRLDSSLYQSLVETRHDRTNSPLSRLPIQE